MFNLLDVLVKANHHNASISGYVYVGCYSAPHIAPGGKGPSTAQGISVYKISRSGELSLIQILAAENPSYLTVDVTRKVLFCVNELGEDQQGKPLGRVSAYQINDENGQLSFLNSQSTQGSWPCHCSVHPNGQYLLAANYGTGNLVAYPINPDNRIGSLLAQHQGAIDGVGPVKDRQEGPHAHMVTGSRDGAYIFGVDLGADRIAALILDEERGCFCPAEPPYIKMAPGSGPRQMVFHSSDQFAYVINELSSSIDIFALDSIRGGLHLLQSVSTLPAATGPTVANTAGAIAIHPSGDWLYATNRGMDSVVKFSIEAQTGRLFAPVWVESEGEVPRGMAIEPFGHWLLVGHQNSDSISVYCIDPVTGELGMPTQTLSSPVPVDFAFYPLG